MGDLSFKTVSILKMRAEDLAVWDFVEFCESIGFSLFVFFNKVAVRNVP